MTAGPLLTTELSARLGYLPALDGLRAISVLAVIAYHEDIEVFGGGFLGVDVFFVISGFLITSLLLDEHRRDGGISLRQFWLRRARRLVPAVLLLVTVVVIAATAWQPSEALNSLRGDALASLAWVANWRFVFDDVSYFASSAESPLRHLWSLAIEEQFYLLWPLLVVVALRRGIASLTVMIGLGWAASVAAMYLLRGDDVSRAYFGTDTRAHTLLLGAGLALLRAYAPASWRVTGRVAPFGAATLLVLFVVADGEASWMYPWGFVSAAIASGLVAVGCTASGTRLETLLAKRPLVAVGAVSYGLYLWHWPVIILLDSGRVGLDGAPLIAVHSAVTAVFTVISYHLIECPVRYRRVPRRLMLSGTPIAVAGAFFVAAVVSPAPVFDAVDRAAPPVVFDPVTTSTTVPSTTGSSAVTPSTEPAPPRPPPGMVLFIGDSVAETVSEAVGAEFAARGSAFRTAVWLGCGVIDGLPVYPTGETVEWAPICVDEALPAQDDAIARHEPDLVVWWSTWETGDRILDGELIEFDTPEGDRIWHELLLDTIDRFSVGGATVAMVAPPPGVGGVDKPLDPSQNDDFEHLRDLFEDAAAERPGVAVVVEVEDAVCGIAEPCRKEIDGVTLRPTDGNHFSREGAALVGGGLVDAMLEGWRSLEPRS